MAILDLSHSFNSQITVYPGSRQPVFKQLASIQQNGYAEKEITFQSHHGTHIDAPAHMIVGGKTLDQFNLSHFTGKAITIDISRFVGNVVPLAFFHAFAETISQVEFVLLYTGWNLKWNSSAYKNNYPTISPEATRFLCDQHLKGIGMDCFSPDPIDSLDYANHLIALSNEVLLIENLTNLEKIPKDQLVNFQCFPIKIEGADGAPVRAMAF